MTKPNEPSMGDEAEAEKWVKDHDLDYLKYGDRRKDRSAYDSLMNYEISPMLEDAFVAGLKLGREKERERCAVLASELKHEQVDPILHMRVARLHRDISRPEGER